MGRRDMTAKEQGTQYDPYRAHGNSCMPSYLSGLRIQAETEILITGL